MRYLRIREVGKNKLCHFDDFACELSALSYASKTDIVWYTDEEQKSCR